MTTPLEIARRVLHDEAEALERLAQSFGDGFDKILSLIIDHTDQLVVSGLGKSGDIARKIAASLTSTGTPAMFMHPVEALHGELGIVTKRSALIALSRSGNTEEILRFVAHFRRRGGSVIGVTQGAASRLLELAQHAILLPEESETGPLNLAPTTSCVQMLAAGDALTMALLHARGFTREDFAQSHPEGSLGKRLLLRASDLMHSGDALPLVRSDAGFRELMVEMNAKQLGLALIVDDAGRLVGTFTDGDLRRVFLREDNTRQLKARDAYARSRRSPQEPQVHTSTVKPTQPAVECLRVMLDERITSLVVVDDSDKPIGLLRERDLLDEGLA